MIEKNGVFKQIRSTLDELNIENTDTAYFGSVANFPNFYGQFKIIGVHSLRDFKDHVAVIKGDPIGKECVPIRIHSECLTGDVFTSKRCDCRQQLEYAMDYLSKEEQGVLIYLRQEGRGIGLFNKLKAYTLQDQGYDTYKANELLGFKDDERNYQIAVDILKGLKISKVKLITNNPLKVEELCKWGIEVIDRIPVMIQANDFNKGYLEAKSEKGHMVDKGGFTCQLNE